MNAWLAMKMNTDAMLDDAAIPGSQQRDKGWMSVKDEDSRIELYRCSACGLVIDLATRSLARASHPCVPTSMRVFL
jgi:hypothetical protein